MSNLKSDLDDYLLLQDERKSTGYKLSMPKMPKLPAILGGTSESSSSNNSWLQDDSGE